MRSPWLVAPAAALAVGCALLSDFRTGGYSLADSGTQGCTGAEDCDAGEVCCVASLSANGSCRSAPCPVVEFVNTPVQLCQGDGECADAGCIDQTCSAAGASLTFRSCGAIMGCATQATPADAGSGAGD